MAKSLKLCLHGSKIIGDLTDGALKTLTALVMKGSSFSPRFSIVIPKAHLDITFTVNVLKILKVYRTILVKFSETHV